MKKRIGRRQLIENLRMMRAEKENAVLLRKATEDKVSRLQRENSEWRERLELLENNPELQYAGTIPGGTFISTARIDISMAARLRDEKETRDRIRSELARKIVEEIIDLGLMRVEYGGEPDCYNTRKEPYQTVRVVARLDVVPWDRLVKRTPNGIHIEPRRFYEMRMVPPVFDDMTRNEELVVNRPAPWE
jgi:hypothetical protein